MPSTGQQPGLVDAFASPFGIFAAAMEYIIDAAQRTVLFWDVMRQCGNQYREHMAEATPNVLDYEVEARHLLPREVGTRSRGDRRGSVLQGGAAA